MQIVIPLKVIRFLIYLPFRLFNQFSNTFVETSLNHIQMTKGEAKDYAQDLASKNIRRLKTLCIFTLIATVVFSSSLIISTSVYTGIYIYSIPKYSQE